LNGNRIEAGHQKLTSFQAYLVPLIPSRARLAAETLLPAFAPAADRGTQSEKKGPLLQGTRTSERPLDGTERLLSPGNVTVIDPSRTPDRPGPHLERVSKSVPPSKT